VSSDAERGGSVADGAADKAAMDERLVHAVPSTVIVSSNPIALVRQDPATRVADPFIYGGPLTMGRPMDPGLRSRDRSPVFWFNARATCFAYVIELLNAR
jgi:hypothetical protein